MTLFVIIPIYTSLIRVIINYVILVIVCNYWKHKGKHIGQGKWLFKIGIRLKSWNRGARQYAYVSIFVFYSNDGRCCKSSKFIKTDNKNQRQNNSRITRGSWPGGGSPILTLLFIRWICLQDIARNKLSIKAEDKDRDTSGTFVPMDKTPPSAMVMRP